MGDELKNLIKNVDDDYLTGLSNKGTVKRAYKDLAQETPAAAWEEETAQVTLKEVTCTIKTPLGESTCSCPSRSICRHIVTAILWLKQETGKEEPKSGEDVLPESEETADASSQDENKDTVSQTKEGKTEAKPLEEILQIPLERLKRACRGKRYQQFLAHLRAGDRPVMEESSIVTVTIPWEEATVKLLEPFSYSTCTCRKKELCAHKAEAVLAYQLEKGRITLQELDGLQEAERVWDEEQVRKTCAGICETVKYQMCTGLSRQSPEISESLERLAVISHRTELPALETMLREAASGYREYFKRSAAFRSEELFRHLLLIHGTAEKLMNAAGQEEIRSLAGTFRDTYEPAGELHLLGMGGRTFSSKAGYEGEIYYFLEPARRRWYTWTDARPVFYEGVRRRPPAGAGNMTAPWGLNCSREQLQSLEFDLSNAKAASGGRLSVSKDSRGEAAGERSLCAKEVKELIFWDYESLLEEHFGTAVQEEEKEIQNRASGRREKLALAGAVRWGETCFDTVEQRFSWSLYDTKGCRLYISMKYKKEEKLTIQLLERLERRLKKRDRKAIVFFGSVYLDENGRLCLYPIDFFIKEAEMIAEQERLKDGWDKESASGTERTATGNNTEKEALQTGILQAMEQYRRESVRQLSDLFVSGLYSIQEDTIAGLNALSQDGERMGLHYAGKEFARISQALEERRHQMEFSPEPILRAARALDAYFQACRKKLSFDMARLVMSESEDEES